MDQLTAVGRSLDESSIAAYQRRLYSQAGSRAERDAVEAGRSEDHLHSALHRRSDCLAVNLGQAKPAVKKSPIEIEREEPVHRRTNRIIARFLWAFENP